MKPAGNSREITFLGVGDTGPTHGPKDGFPVERYSELIRPTFAAADIRFGNCERQYSAQRTPDGRSGLLGSHLPFGDARRAWDFRSPGRGEGRFEEIVRSLNRAG